MDHDTKALLLECGAGVQMAVGAIDDVLGQTRDKKLEQALLSCREAHKALGQQTKALLDAEHIPEKGANAMARGMSWLKTSTKLAVSPADETVADLITDGCNMGVKSLIRYRSSTPSRRSVSPCRPICNLHNFLARSQKFFRCAFFPRGV